MFAAIKIALYLLVAVLAARAFVRQKRGPVSYQPRAVVAAVRSCLLAIRQRGRSAPPKAWRALGWLVVALICVALAIARLVDVDALVGASTLDVPLEIYEQRRGVQTEVLWTLLVVALIVVGILVFFTRRAPVLAAAMTAAILLVFYVGARAISLHSMDTIVGHFVLGVRINSWIEGIGIIVVGAASFRGTNRDL